MVKMLSISEFSRVSEIPVKTIRYYHELGILSPLKIDARNGYRYFGDESLEAVNRIKILKTLGFSLNEIKHVLSICNEDKDVIIYIQTKLHEVKNKVSYYKSIEKQLKKIKTQICQIPENPVYNIHEKLEKQTHIAGIRFKGKYQEIGKYYSLLYKKVGLAAKGKPWVLYYDLDYREDNADIEACIEISKSVDINGLNCRILPGGKVVSMLHQGKYGTQGSSYKKLFEYCSSNGYKIIAPIKEIYLKGPGLLFPVNPDKYLTEICISVEM